MADEAVKLLEAWEVEQIGEIAEHWDPGFPAVPLARDTVRRIVATLEALQRERDEWKAAYQGVINGHS